MAPTKDSLWVPATKHSLACRQQEQLGVQNCHRSSGTLQNRWHTWFLPSTRLHLREATGLSVRGIVTVNCIQPGNQETGFVSCSVALGLKPITVFWAPCLLSETLHSSSILSFLVLRPADLQGPAQCSHTMLLRFMQVLIFRISSREWEQRC